jgi:ABC-type transport system involved in cytochrome c biogenesis permease component
MGSGISYALAIAKKDLITQMRKRYEAFSMFLFAIIAVFVLGLVLSSSTFIIPDPAARLQVMNEIGSGMLWVVVFFIIACSDTRMVCISWKGHLWLLTNGTS